MSNTKTFTPEPEATPQRMLVSGQWEHGVCKRCLANNVRTGDVIVRIFGKGWWHDACYRVVNPWFYDGLDEPSRRSATPQADTSRPADQLEF